MIMFSRTAQNLCAVPTPGKGLNGILRLVRMQCMVIIKKFTSRLKGKDCLALPFFKWRVLLRAIYNRFVSRAKREEKESGQCLLSSAKTVFSACLLTFLSVFHHLMTTQPGFIT